MELKLTIVVFERVNDVDGASQTSSPDDLCVVRASPVQSSPSTPVVPTSSRDLSLSLAGRGEGRRGGQHTSPALGSRRTPTARRKFNKTPVSRRGGKCRLRTERRTPAVGCRQDAGIRADRNLSTPRRPTWNKLSILIHLDGRTRPTRGEARRTKAATRARGPGNGGGERSFGGGGCARRVFVARALTTIDRSERDFERSDQRRVGQTVGDHRSVDDM